MRVLRSVARIWTTLLGVMALALTMGLVARYVLPAAPWIAPPALAASLPADGATDVLPRSSITLTFSQPMNRHSVERALRITPPTSGTFAWRDGGRTLVLTPGASLRSNSVYTLSLEAGALGRWWRPLEAPVQVSFRTARAPTVVAALPAPSEVAPTDSPIALVFSQPMVAPADLNVPVNLPHVRIDPPVAALARWVAVDTLVLHPDELLEPSTAYRVSVAAGLTDVRGAELIQPFAWSWRTRGPTLLARSPDDGERWVGPRQPLAVTLSQPLGLDAIRAALQITPTIAGDLEATTLPAGAQVITFTPRIKWEPGRTYEVRLGAGDAGNSSGGDANPAPDQVWRFTAEPLPDLVASFPGQGQLLPRGQSIRLIFSAPMEAETLRAGLSLDPPAGDVRLSVGETEVRVAADLRPATAYTLTVAAGVPDRNGAPLGRDFRLRFLTAPALPALSLPDISGSVAILPVDQTAQLSVERINLSALNLELYRLDEATLLRTLDFERDDWSDFTPERYNQPLLERWRVTLDDPLNETVRATLPITQTDSAPLAPGAYYLRIQTPEGPRADTVLLVSPVTLTLKQSDAEALVWATDAISGTPVVDLPLTLYRGGAVVARGRSDAAGLWQVRHQRRAGDTPYLVIGGPDALAVVRSDWRSAVGPATSTSSDSSSDRLALVTDRTVYPPGATVQVGGLARRAAPFGGLTLPGPGSRLSLALQREGSSVTLASSSLTLPASGVISGGLRLDAGLPPGAYMLRASLGDALVRLPLRVVAPDPFFAVTLDPADGDRLIVQATSAGAPAVGAAVRWSATALPVAAPLPVAGFRFGDDEAPPPPLVTLEGTGVTDAAGRFEAPLLARTTLTQTLRYRVLASVGEPGGLSSEAAATFEVAPDGLRLGLRLASPIVQADEPPQVEALALDATGGPAAGVALNLEVFRRAQTSGPGTDSRSGDVVVVSRRATTDAQGRAIFNLVRFSPGEYRVVVTAGGRRSATTLWVVAPGYTNWRTAGDVIRVVADRDSYRPGETARLLVTLPVAAATALVTLEQSGVISAEVRTLSAGQLLPIAITPAMAPSTHVGVVIASREPGAATATLRAGYVELAVVNETPPLTLTLAADQPAYAPGATATLTITASDEQGGAPADLLLLLTRDDGALPVIDLAAALDPRRPSGFSVARSDARHTVIGTPVGEGGGRRMARVEALLFDARLRTGDDGMLTTTLMLPPEPGRWRVTVYAAGGAQRFGAASLALDATVPLVLQPETPPGMRAGDQADVALLVRNTTVVSQEVRAILTTGGAIVQGGAVLTRTLDAGAEHRFVWNVRAGAVTTATLGFDVTAASGARVVARATLPVGPGEVLRATGATLAATRSLTHTIVLSETLVQAGGPRALVLEAAPGVYAALVRSAATLAALPERSVEQEASLLQLAAQLGRVAPPAEARSWRDQARRSLEALSAAQTDDGAWGWWPDESFHPFVTGYVLEAQAMAQAVFGFEITPSPRALALLRRADRPGVDPDLRAYIQYVLAQVGQGDPAAAAALLAEGLDADGLAYLALALPPERADAALLRLLAQARRAPVAGGEERAVYWEARGGDPLAGSPVGATALVVRALQRSRSDSALIDPALQTLRRAWTGEGWATAYDASRAAAALLAGDDVAPLPRAYRVLLNGQLVLEASQPVTTTSTVTLPGSGLPVRNELRIEFAGAAGSSDSPLLVAYRVLTPALPAAVPSDALPSQLAVQQDYLDPLSGERLDPAALRLGQLVRVRLTLVAVQAHPLLELTATLPAAFAPVEAAPAPPFSFVRRNGAGGLTEVTFAGADIQPGVYTQTYLARVVATGTFVAPPLRAAPGFNPDAMVAGPGGQVGAGAP